MKTTSLGWLLLPLFFLVPGCPPGGGGSDGGSPDGDVDLEDIEITVSGTAYIHPEAAKWFQSQGLPQPPVEGLTLRVEEPLKVVLGQTDLGIFGEVTLGADGKFSVSHVRTELVNLGIAAGILDTSDAGAPDGGVYSDGGCCIPAKRVVRAGTAVYDVQLADGVKPRADISGAKAYAIPTLFHDQLTQAVGEAQIRAITANQQKTLIGAGYILGQVVDAQGAPVAGVKVNPEAMPQLKSQFFYPNADFTQCTTSGGPGTSANGLFIFVFDAKNEPLTFTFGIENRPEYKKRNAGAAKDTSLVLMVYPGDKAP